MIPSRRRLVEHLVPDEDLRIVTYGRLVDDSIRGTVAIGLTDRRVVCLSAAGDLVDVDYATISTIRSFSRSRLTFEGIDPRLLTIGFGGLSALLVGLAVVLAASPWTGSVGLLATALVCLTTGAALAALFGARLLPSPGSIGVVRWTRARLGSLFALGRQVVSTAWALLGWCGARGRRAYWWILGQTNELFLWGSDLLRRGYVLNRTWLASLSWWSVQRVRGLARWCRTCGDAVYRQYAIRTNRPLAPLSRLVYAAARSAVVRRVVGSVRALRRSIGYVSAGGANWLRAGLSSLRSWHVGRRIRSLPRFLGGLGDSLSRAIRPRVPAVSRPRLGRVPRPSFGFGSRSSGRHRRWPRLFAGAVAVGSLASLVTVGPSPLVVVVLAIAVGSFAIVAYATRLDNDCTGVQFSRERETELSIHTVDGDTVRLLLDPDTDLDAELSRSAAQVARTTPDTPSTGSVAE